MNERPPEPAEEDTSGEQIEGIDFRLVYSGRKLFWRSQQSVDLEFYLHDRVSCLEVAGIDASNSQELNRIYLDYNILLNIISDIIGKRSTDDSEEVNKICYFYSLFESSSSRASPTCRFTRRRTPCSCPSRPSS